MTAVDDWTRWGQSWRRQCGIDVDRLQRQIHRRRRQKIIQLAVGICLALASAGLMIHLLLTNAVPVRLRLGMFGLIALVALILGMAIGRVSDRRQTSGHSIPELLQVLVRQARNDVRKGWRGLIGMALVTLIAFSAAWPWLAPSRWRNDPSLAQALAINAGCLLIPVVVGVATNIWRIRQHGQRLRRARALLREYRTQPADGDV